VLQDQLVYTPTGLHRLLGDKGGVLIADNGIQGSNDTDAVVDVFLTYLLVGRDTIDAGVRAGYRTRSSVARPTQSNIVP